MAERAPRRWVWALVALYALQLASLVHSILWHVGQPSGGFMPHTLAAATAPLYASPTSLEASAVERDIGGPLELIAINGEPVCSRGGRCGVHFARSLVDLRPGATNRFVVASMARGEPREVTLTAGPGQWSAIMGWAWQGFAIGGVGLIHVILGLVVWRARPRDPASLPLLLLALAVGTVLAAPLYVDSWTLYWGALTRSANPLMMPLMFLLGHSFSTQSQAHHTLRFRLQMMVAVPLGLGESVGRILSVERLADVDWALDYTSPLLGAGAVVSLVLTLESTWRASRRPAPLLQRRRAVVFAHAVLLGFLYPTLWVLVRPWIIDSGYQDAAFIGLLVSFSSFPLLLGYAIVRHRMFDLRLVLRQGLVYAVLSVGLTLAYVALVVTAYRLFGSKSSGAAVAASFAVAILFGFGRVRVERLIDGMVFRGRAVFRRAIELGSRGLSRAHSPVEVAAALRPSLIEALGLSRAYLGVVPRDRGVLVVYPIGNSEDPESGRTPQELPERASLGELEEISTSLSLDRPSSVFDSVGGAGVEAFWERFGLETVMPFGESERDTRGLLLLGPKRDGRPFDPEDTALVRALGDQVALALENARAFEKLSLSTRTVLDLTQGIVHEANTPLGVLESSLDTLGRSVARLDQETDASRRERVLSGARRVTRAAMQSEQRLRQLIEGLKAYVNLEEAERRRTDLRRCVQDTVESLPAEARRRVRLDLPEQSAVVNAFPAKLRHVLHNLIDNALRASGDEQSVTVALVCEPRVCRVVVSDRGKGMSPELREKAFEFGISEKRSESRIGLRLGLPYARRVAEELDGHVSLDSELGQGTRVTLTLPAAE